MAKDTGCAERYEIDGKTVYTVWSNGYQWFWSFTGDDDATGPYTSKEEATYCAKSEFTRRNG